MNPLGVLLGLGFGSAGFLVVTWDGPWRGRTYVLRVRYAIHGKPPVGKRFSERWLTRSRAHRIEMRQRAAGVRANPDAHLLQLVTGASAGLLLGTFATAVLLIAHWIHQPIAVFPLLLCSAVSGWLFMDRRLDVAIRRRRANALRELPVFAESLAIAVSAGAALPNALELVSKSSPGVVADAVQFALRELETGTNLERALHGFAEDLPVPALRTLVDAMCIALDRGTPLVEVLHAQASDVRAESRRALLEAAGKREVAMMIPVVFLVLPAVVVVALYPAFSELAQMA